MRFLATGSPKMKTLFRVLFVANGVTGVRDLGGDLEPLKRWRARAEGGDLLVPRKCLDTLRHLKCSILDKHPHQPGIKLAIRYGNYHTALRSSSHGCVNPATTRLDLRVETQWLSSSRILPVRETVGLFHEGQCVQKLQSLCESFRTMG